jgi:DNA-binding transcriptional MerR regulator
MTAVEGFPPGAGPGGLRVGELAARAGTTVKTVRYYEVLGLLAPPWRAPDGYRVYPPAALGQLRFVRRAKVLGLSLAEIQRLVDAGRAGAWGTVRAAVVALLDEKLTACDRQIAELTALRTALLARRRRAAAARAARPCSCPEFESDCTCLPVEPGELAPLAGPAAG